MYHNIVQLNTFGISDIGLVREHNEDVWAAYPERGLFLLADGMGGHAAGEVAARGAVDHVYELVKQWHPPKQIMPDEAVSFFHDLLKKVNTFVYQKGQENPSLSGMGTTLCLLYLLPAHAIIAHVGDSRIYRFRENHLEQLTEDHSLIAELISLGAMKADESETFPYKHILTRAIGTHSLVEPTVNYLTIKPNDCFLLCSDGLTNMISDSDIERVLTSHSSLEESGSALVGLANASGGIDNITLMLVKISDDLSR